MPSRRASRRMSRKVSNMVEESLVGTRVCCDRFVLTGTVLGRGCFCCVLEAMPTASTHATASPVAVKIFPPEDQWEDDTEKSSERSPFVQEVQVLERLTQGEGRRYVVDLIDYSKCKLGNPGMEADGSSFLVLEKGGETLEQWVTTHRRSLGLLDRDLVPFDALMEPVSSAACCLGHLERMGWVHLDFKAENLLLVGSVWKLIDLDGCCEVGSVLTAEDIVVTPVHCPPELAHLYVAEEQGASTVACIASHAWSFGSVMVELVTGSPPLESRYTTLSANGLHDDEDGICIEYFTWLAQARSEDIQLSERLAKHLPKQVFELVLACLDCIPAARPALSSSVPISALSTSPVSGDVTTTRKGGASGQNKVKSQPSITCMGFETPQKSHEKSEESANSKPSWWDCCCVAQNLAVKPTK